MKLLPILLGACVLSASSACIAPSVVATEQRAVHLDQERDWRAGTAEDVAGVFVSTRLTGPLAASVRKLVYLFTSGGSYTGAALIDDAPPRFEVIRGGWTLTPEGLRLDGGPPGLLEVAPDGSLRLSGDEGRVVLRKERDQ